MQIFQIYRRYAFSDVSVAKQFIVKSSDSLYTPRIM